MNSSDSCYKSFMEFCTNKAELSKSTLSENTALADYNEKNPNAAKTARCS
ncbi:uncharacterized protein PHALS_08215 [Plasmopara halstedii]|uniref:Uncharacterized protein n=1 Tax=Plasmopara halstedii TaxID=4781 RepID=A0A0N7L4A4_PLAHL|nr:uncharacterized protein PHALS_08215 [Plasmopara halstedii]CEG38123.1 hypothetical protein PHALS_08215 [Plasmopara halstedii]|eukprot:XP_024574492.1 hypothetical protein PHALS_08215 [Plasmopara halstedii]